MRAPGQRLVLSPVGDLAAGTRGLRSRRWVTRGSHSPRQVLITFGIFGWAHKALQVIRLSDGVLVLCW